MDDHRVRISPRAALVLLLSALTAGGAAWLTYLAERSVPRAVLAGFVALAGALVFFDRIVGPAPAGDRPSVDSDRPRTAETPDS
jgi:hypothetical protein